MKIINLQYHDLIDNPLGAVESIYKKFNKSYSRETEQALSKFLEQDAGKGKRAHKYKCTDFGLTPEKIRTRFKDYIDLEAVAHTNPV